MSRRAIKKRPMPSGLTREVSHIALVLAAVFALISLFRPDLTGQAGEMSNYLLVLGFGSSGAFVVCAALLYYAVLGRGRPRIFVALGLWTMATLVLLYLSIPAIQRPLLSLTAGGTSGALGVLLGRLVVSLFGVIGAWILVLSTLMISILLLTGGTLRSFMGHLSAISRWLEQSLRRESKSTPARPMPAEVPIALLAPLSPETEPEPLPPPVPRPEAVAENVEQLKLPQGDYSLPSLLLLNRGLRQSTARGSREEKENIRILEETLSNFSIRAKVVDVTRGPTCTRYEIQMAPGTKVSKITGLSNDLAMSLASEGVRIEAPIPGKAAIGIEVPNKARGSVLLRDVLESAEFASSTSPLTVALGKDIEGQTVTADLSQMPHLLIAGATGSGKSVCINTLVCSVLYKSRPDEVKLMLIDPKVVELSSYNGIPHLIAPVLNHPKKAAAALKWATGEMERRYAAFARAGVRDIERYNERAAEKGTDKLPFVLIVIDELADLMMVARSEVEDAICRLAQMARAAGMHLVIGTQRPSTDVITGLIKANIPSRLSFTVSSATDSRVILDMMGAEKLLGRGDLLFLPVGQSKAKRVQGAFVSNREIERLVDFVSSQGEAVYVEALNRLEEIDVSVKEGETGLDERFDDAVRIVVETGQASVSMLQRRMRLGYTRAARIVDQMQEAGIVGPADGSKPRSINKNHSLVKSILDPSKRSGVS